MRLRVRFLLPLLCFLIAVPAFAQNYPVKPVRIVVPTNPGGGADIQARLVAKAFQESMGGTFIVDPAPPKTPFSSAHFVVGNYHFDGNSLVVLFWAAAVVIGLTLFFKLTARALHYSMPGVAIGGRADEQLIGGELRKVMYQTVIKITQLIAAASRFEFLQYRQFYPCSFGKGHRRCLGNSSFVHESL